MFTNTTKSEKPNYESTVVFCSYGQILSAFDTRLMWISSPRSILGKKRKKWEILSAIFLSAAVADFQMAIWLRHAQLDRWKLVLNQSLVLQTEFKGYLILALLLLFTGDILNRNTPALWKLCLAVCGRNHQFSIKQYALGASNQEYWMPRQDEYPFCYEF